MCRDNKVKIPLPGVEERSKIGDKTSPFPSADIPLELWSIGGA